MTSTEQDDYGKIVYFKYMNINELFSQSKNKTGYCEVSSVITSLGVFGMVMDMAIAMFPSKSLMFHLINWC